MNRPFSISDLAWLRGVSLDFGIEGDDYMVACFSPADISADIHSEPMSIAGLSYIIVKRGSLAVNIDFQDVVLERGSMMSTDPSKRFLIKSGQSIDAEVLMMSFSRKFLHDLNFDLHTLNLHEFVETPPDVVTHLSEPEVAILEHLAQVLLLNANHNSEPTFSLQIARSVTQTLIYQQLQIFSARRSKTIIKTDSPNGSRQLAYVHEFLQQLQLHHTRHRSISFYADKLCISQKYLSHVIKEATGRSASDWIAEYVVMEAKNLLRFSHKNVQQVAYSLNFPTQSSFGKYFKHVTGISPSEFQKG